MWAETADVGHPPVEEIAVRLVDVINVVLYGKGMVFCVRNAGTELVGLHHVGDEDMVVQDIVLQLYAVVLEEKVNLLACHWGDCHGLSVRSGLLHQGDGVGAELAVEVLAVIGEVLAKWFGNDVVLVHDRNGDYGLAGPCPARLPMVLENGGVTAEPSAPP